MDSKRRLRRWVTARISQGAVRCAPWLTHGAVDALQAVVALAGPGFPVVRKIVADNMRAVELYTPQRHREYFCQVAVQLSGWMHVFRHARPAAADRPGSMSADLARIVEERIQLDESVERLTQAAARGRGVVLMAMHVVDVPLWLGRINQVVPMTVLARYSKDPRRQSMKERWFRTIGPDYIAETSRDGERGLRIARMAEALRDGRVVLITPDVIRKRDEGKPVRFFNRQVHLPSGAAVLSVKTGAPLMMLSAEPAGTAISLRFHGPFEGAARPGTEDWEDAAIAERMQWFAGGLEAFLREHAPLWFFWADKRWTRMFQGDSRYVRPGEPSEHAPTPAAGDDQKGGRKR